MRPEPQPDRPDIKYEPPGKGELWSPADLAPLVPKDEPPPLTFEGKVIDFNKPRTVLRLVTDVLEDWRRRGAL